MVGMAAVALADERRENNADWHGLWLVALSH
jgi:hypothetical protein